MKWKLWRGFLVVGIGIASLSFCPRSADANSYSYNGLRKEELPSTASHLAVWKKPDQENRSISREQILLFLKNGVHSFRCPWEVKRAKFEERIRQSANAAAEKRDREPEGEKLSSTFESEPIPDWRIKQLDAFEAEWLALKKQYSESPNITGAFIGPEKRIFLWRLTSPGVLRIEHGVSLCYLELPDNAFVEFSSDEEREAALPLPSLPKDSWNLSRDFLPATGNFEIVKRNAIEAFLKGGIPLEERESLALAIKENWPPITWKWFPESVANRKKSGLKTDLDEPIGDYIINTGGFASVFADKQNRLWRAQLLGDFHLRLTDYHGHRILLELPHSEQKPVANPFQ